jgi:uncharacterized membrane protein YsdA (DUF1294 family)
VAWGVALYLAIVNLITFLAFASDKASARARRRRIPERALLQLAGIGGGVGAVAGQLLMRHKTRKEPFATWLRLILFVQAVALTGLIVWWLRA